MFEGKPPIAHLALPCAAQTYADEDLALLSWDDLIARLTAARDLRAALSSVPETARASFDSLAALHRANRPAFAARDNEPAVNLLASGNGKEDGANEGPWAGKAQPDPRGIA